MHCQAAWCFTGKSIDGMHPSLHWMRATWTIGGSSALDGCTGGYTALLMLRCCTSSASSMSLTPTHLRASAAVGSHPLPRRRNHPAQPERMCPALPGQAPDQTMQGVHMHMLARRSSSARSSAPELDGQAQKYWGNPPAHVNQVGRVESGRAGCAPADEGQQGQQRRLQGAPAAGQAQEGGQLVQRQRGQRRPQHCFPALERRLHRQHQHDRRRRAAAGAQRRRLPQGRRS